MTSLPNCLEASVRLPQHASEEMTLGELHRRSVTISYDDCRATVDGFDFETTSEE